MTHPGGSNTAERLAADLHERRAAEKVRAAATLLGEAGSQLSAIVPPKGERIDIQAWDDCNKLYQAWYDCNKLYHGAIKWLDAWERIPRRLPPEIEVKIRPEDAFTSTNLTPISTGFCWLEVIDRNRIVLYMGRVAESDVALVLSRAAAFDEAVERVPR